MAQITVIRGGAIGDFVLTLPAIDALRAAFPHLPLHLIGHPPTVRLARPDRILDHDSRLLTPLHTPGTDIPPATATLFADIHLLLAYATDPDNILSTHLRSLVPGPVLVHDPRPPEGTIEHITDHLLRPLRRHGIHIPNPSPHIHLHPEDCVYAETCWQQRKLNSPNVVFHPGSGGRHKCWPLERFLELAEELQQRRIQILFLWGPVEEDRLGRLPDPLHPLHPPGLLDLAGLLARADLFVGNDSGPSHIAAAVGTPTLTLFGPTDPRLWSPRSSRARILRAPHSQLSALDVDLVLAAVLAALDVK
ncbi:MAG: glycosyltransferase family 9 protein [Gemmatimonadetes bacterium]|jgi:ADP-heptose:LPS heptosyltransferase|nr:glycosyltransferase family 9 protein [Gemmatimonadota bacterium]